MTDFPMTLEPSLYAKQMFDSRILPPDLLAAWKAGHEHLDHLSATYMALVLITMNELEEAEHGPSEQEQYEEDVKRRDRHGLEYYIKPPRQDPT